jgi:hypothetical protein
LPWRGGGKNRDGEPLIPAFSRKGEGVAVGYFEVCARAFGNVPLDVFAATADDSPAIGEIVLRGLCLRATEPAKRSSAKQKRSAVIPSPRGEGQDEGVQNPKKSVGPNGSGTSASAEPWLDSPKNIGARQSVAPPSRKKLHCSPSYVWYNALVKALGALLFEIGDKGQRQMVRDEHRQRSRFVESGPKANSRKSLISMIISESFSSFLGRVERTSLPPRRHDQKREKLFWMLAGAVCRSLVNITGGSDRGQSHQIKPELDRMAINLEIKDSLQKATKLTKKRQITATLFSSFPSVQESGRAEIALNRT